MKVWTTSKERVRPSRYSQYLDAKGSAFGCLSYLACFAIPNQIARRGKGTHSRPLGPPSPKSPRSARLHVFERSLSPPWGSVVQRDFQQHHLYGHHNYSLYKKCQVITGARPIKDLQYGCCKHNPRDIEREASRSAVAVDGENLIGVRREGREDETAYMRSVLKMHEAAGGWGKTYKRGVKEEINVATIAMMNATASCKRSDR